MATPNEFWLALHELAEAYFGEGETHEERLNNIKTQFRNMPSIAQNEVLVDLNLMLAALPKVGSGTYAMNGKLLGKAKQAAG